MALLELSDGLSNEACVSLGNKLVCSEAVTPVAPPAVRALICAVSGEGGGGRRRVGGAGETKYTRLTGKRSRKKGNGMSHATCFVGAFTFHFGR